MTDPMRPDDRELEQYLKGDSAISKRYREGSGETAPPELDEAILALARAEVRRKPPSLNRVMAPVALAASLVIAVNLAWNVREAEPVPAVPLEQPAASADAAPAAAPPPALAKSEPKRRAAAQEQERQEVAQAAQEMRAKQAAERSVMAMESAGASASAAPAPQAALADAAAPALSEAQKIDRLIAHIGALEGAVFIRNGKEYGPAEAAKHLQYKREKAGDRVKTADDFIRLCASHSYLSGEAYLIRFADGRTRTAEDVLREELARL